MAYITPSEEQAQAQANIPDGQVSPEEAALIAAANAAAAAAQRKPGVYGWFVAGPRLGVKPVLVTVGSTAILGGIAWAIKRFFVKG